MVLLLEYNIFVLFPPLYILLNPVRYWKTSQVKKKKKTHFTFSSHLVHGLGHDFDGHSQGPG